MKPTVLFLAAGGQTEVGEEKLAGARIDAVVMQMHLSEVTISAPEATPRGEMIQAIVLRNFSRAWFAVEAMEGIT